jgi:4'-phosphopantetheinyl transferase
MPDADTVQVWRVPLGVGPARLQALAASLAPAEQARAARLQREQDRNAYVVARGMLRHLLGEYLGLPPDAVALQANEFGKPGLDDAAPALYFNLSRSGGIALYAFSGAHPVGIDIERERDDVHWSDIAHRYFAAAEAAALEALPAEQRRAGFFRCWARKEAYVKAVGRGLAMGLERFEVPVTLAPGEAAAVLCPTEPAGAAQWWVRDLPIDAGYAAALVTPTQHARVVFQERDP